jgi:hypothetical protein
LYQGQRRRAASAAAITHAGGSGSARKSEVGANVLDQRNNQVGQ